MSLAGQSEKYELECPDLLHIKYVDGGALLTSQDTLKIKQYPVNATQSYIADIHSGSLFLNLTPGSYIKASRDKNSIHLEVMNEEGKNQYHILLDAGHGGHDPGAMSQQGYLEKDITLQFIGLLSKHLKRPDIKVSHIRESDVTIDKYTRLEKNILTHPDLFVSIHADAYTNTNTRGLGVFLLDEKSLPSRQTQKIIQQYDLDKASFTTKSRDIAKTALNFLSKKTLLHAKDPKYASLVVLRAPHIPSMLIEIGFLSNPLEAENLNDTAYLDKLAKSLASALLRHIDIV